MANDLPSGPASARGGAINALAQALGIGAPDHAANQRLLARPLATVMIEEMATDSRYNGLVDFADGTQATLPELGRQMVEAMWPAAEGDETQLRAIEARIAQITNGADQRKCAELLARLGHLHQMAGLLLRSLELDSADTPTTVNSFLVGNLGGKNAKGKDYVAKGADGATEAVAALNRPRLEFTFTAHPTNTNSESSMVAQREIAIAIDAWRNHAGNARDVQQALRNYLNAPLLPERDDGSPGFTVRTETSFMLRYLNNLYTDLDQVYGGYDKAMGEKFPGSYHPETLRLNLAVHSWGSSADKDGNSNVNADTTLYALAAHHLQILQRYEATLEKIPDLSRWHSRIEHAKVEIGALLKSLEGKIDTQGHLSEEEFDFYSQQLCDEVAPLKKQEFIQDIEEAYRLGGAEHRKDTLSLLRHVHTFGFSFGTMEYRETAEQYERIVAKLVPEYGALLDPILALEKEAAAKEKEQARLLYAGEQPERCALLGQEIEALQTQIAAQRAAIEPERRKVLQTVLQDPARQHVLRERFQIISATGAGQAYSDADIAPIAYATRKRLELARDFPQAIDNHVLAECQDTSNLLELLLLQRATDVAERKAALGIVPLLEESDTLEKAPAILRGALANASYRDHLAKVAEAHGDAVAQQVQLAHSDNARRNGLPAARGLIYRAHEQLAALFAEYNQGTAQKVALQFYEGGSLSDSYRGGTRAISAAINEYGLHDFSKMTVQGGDLLNYFNLPHSTYRVIMRNLTHNAARLDPAPDAPKAVPTPRPFIDRAVNALIATKDEYKQNLFHSPLINRFLEAVGFAQESKAGNIGSRMVTRGGNGINRVDVTKVRSIAFSEGFQHAGLNPSWLGALELPGKLREQGIPVSSPEQLKELYNGKLEVPAFKDAIDRMLFGLTRTDLPYIEKLSGNHELMTRFKKEYGVAFKLCLETYTGKPLKQFTGGRELDQLTTREQHDILVNEVYNHMPDVFADQDRYTQLVRQMKKHWLVDDDKGLSEQAANDNFLNRVVLHNAMDTIIHGRLPLIDDPTYQTLYCEKRDIVRRHVPQRTSTLSAA